MTVKCICNWSTFEAGKEYDVPADEGNRLIGTGVAVVVELDAVKKRDRKGGFVKPPKEKDE